MAGGQQQPVANAADTAGRHDGTAQDESQHGASGPPNGGHLRPAHDLNRVAVQESDWGVSRAKVDQGKADFDRSRDRDGRLQNHHRTTQRTQARGRCADAALVLQRDNHMIACGRRADWPPC